MISLDDELLTVPQVAKLLPGNTQERTVWRWFSVGVKGIKLESIKIGGKTFTSKKALEQFLH